MNKAILIGIVLIFLVGCDMEFKNICMGRNESIAPTERFCNDLGMDIVEYGGWDRMWGCSDEDGEIHNYLSKPNRTTNTWKIGNMTYVMEWSCI